MSKKFEENQGRPEARGKTTTTKTNKIDKRVETLRVFFLAVFIMEKLQAVFKSLFLLLFSAGND